MGVEEALGMRKKNAGREGFFSAMRTRPCLLYLLVALGRGGKRRATDLWLTAVPLTSRLSPCCRRATDGVRWVHLVPVWTLAMRTAIFLADSRLIARRIWLDENSGIGREAFARAKQRRIRKCDRWHSHTVCRM